MATYQSIRYNVDYQGKAGSLMPLLLFTSDGSDATADFTSKIDSTYDEYLFIFNDIHPETNDKAFQWQVNASGESGYNETITSSAFRALHDEGDATTSLEYSGGSDKAQGTSYQVLIDGIGNDNDQTCSGLLRLYNPSSTTFVKHFVSQMHKSHHSDYAQIYFIAGYINTTTAIDDIQFKMSSGEIQAGTIQMFGVI